MYIILILGALDSQNRVPIRVDEFRPPLVSIGVCIRRTTFTSATVEPKGTINMPSVTSPSLKPLSLNKPSDISPVPPYALCVSPLKIEENSRSRCPGNNDDSNVVWIPLSDVVQDFNGGHKIDIILSGDSPGLFLGEKTSVHLASVLGNNETDGGEGGGKCERRLEVTGGSFNMGRKLGHCCLPMVSSSDDATDDSFREIILLINRNNADDMCVQNYSKCIPVDLRDTASCSSCLVSVVIDQEGTYEQMYACMYKYISIYA